MPSGLTWTPPQFAGSRSGPSAARAPSPTAGRPAKRRTLYLQFDWLKSASPWPDNPDGRKRRESNLPAQLEPWCVYHALVSLESSRPGPGAKLLRPNSDLKLHLEYSSLAASGPEPVTIWPCEAHEIKLDVADEFVTEFVIEVAKDCDRQLGCLRLSACEQWRDSCTFLKIEVELLGSDRARMLETLDLDLDPVQAPGVINIHATAPRPTKLKLAYFLGFRQISEIGPVQRPDQALADLMKEWGYRREMPEWQEYVDLARNVRQAVEQFSRRRSGDLLGELVQYGNADPRPSLIIHDHTGFEVPWEMMGLADGWPVGAVFPVARWTRVRNYPATIVRNASPGAVGVTIQARPAREVMRVEPRNRMGSVIAYVDHTLGIGLLETILDDSAIDHCKNMATLLDRLKQPIGGVGLVYLYCHGEFDRDHFRRSTLDSLPAVGFSELETKEEDRPLFFINACESARSTLLEGSPAGFHEELLARVAGGYIGTLGPVEAELAAELAAILLSGAASGDVPWNPAEALRRLRQEATDRFLAPGADAADEEEATVRFLNTFMYVYYGNPLATFRIQAPIPPGDAP